MGARGSPIAKKLSNKIWSDINSDINAHSVSSLGALGVHATMSIAERVSTEDFAVPRRMTVTKTGLVKPYNRGVAICNTIPNSDKSINMPCITYSSLETLKFVHSERDAAAAMMIRCKR